MLNGWGGYILTQANYVNAFFSHDEYIDFFAAQGGLGLLEDVRKEFGRSNIRPKKSDSVIVGETSDYTRNRMVTSASAPFYKRAVTHCKQGMAWGLVFMLRCNQIPVMLTC